MEDNQIRRTIDALAAEEHQLLDALRRVEIRLTQVRAARESLTALQSEEPVVFEGKLADAIRTVLRANVGRSLSPVEVRDRLIAIGYDLSPHDNPMASIHSVLKRMAESKEMQSKQAKDGSGTRYYYDPPQIPPGSVAMQGLPPRTFIGPSSSVMRDIIQKSQQTKTEKLAELDGGRNPNDLENLLGHKPK